MRFKVVSVICWLILVTVQTILLTHYGLPVKPAIYDSVISNMVLAAAALLVTTTLQYYIPQKNKYVYLVALVTTLAVCWLFISRAFLMLIPGSEHYSRFFSDSMLLRFVFAFLVIGCMALISVLWYTIQDQQQAEQRKAQAEKLSKEAELYKLRQQLQPHFLFNSLNSINALIGWQPQQARTMIHQLSDFLRGTLKKEQDQWVSIEDELQHLHLYLDIEKIRFGHRLSTSIIQEDTARACVIPAMLLQPVVENAIKFGLYDTTGDIMINIHAWKEDSHLFIEVKNPFDTAAHPSNKGTGFGLSSVERRLNLLFNRSGLLQTSVHHNIFTTTIKIPQQ